MFGCQGSGCTMQITLKVTLKGLIRDYAINNRFCLIQIFVNGYYIADVQLFIFCSSSCQMIHNFDTRYQASGF